MKIEYDVNLYRTMANYSVNEIIQVTNRKGIKSSIHINNITKLSWNELQLLVPNGSNKFTKMVLLFQKYSRAKKLSNSKINGKSLSSTETYEINEYIKIYKNNSFTKHYEVNEFITANNLWNIFVTIRSLNDHDKFKEIEGIQPKYFEIICNILSISGEKGLPLDAYKTY